MATEAWFKRAKVKMERRLELEKMLSAMHRLLSWTRAHGRQHCLAQRASPDSRVLRINGHISPCAHRHQCCFRHALTSTRMQSTVAKIQHESVTRSSKENWRSHCTLCQCVWSALCKSSIMVCFAHAVLFLSTIHRFLFTFPCGPLLEAFLAAIGKKLVGSY